MSAALPTGAITAEHPDWDASRGTFNLTIDQRPTCIALPESDAEVARIVREAAAHGLRVAAQRTGHNAAPLGALDETLLLRTDRLRGVEIDAGARSARVRAGDLWEDVVPEASELGLAALHGSTPDVSVAGYSLGGGLGWYGRQHGLATNSVTAIELVTADGELRRVDGDNDPELFWALRGGGGNFGVVTALEFDLLPISEVYAGALFFPWERAGEVLAAWHAWIDAAGGIPESVTSVGRIMQFPPLPMVPEPLRGKPFVIIEAVCLTSEAEGADLLAPLRGLGPQIDTFAMVAPVGLSDLHMDPREPVPYVSDHWVVGDLPVAAIDELVELLGPGSGSTVLSFELRHLGGALGRSEPDHGALAQMPGSFLAFGVGMALGPDAVGALLERFALTGKALEAHHSGHYLNFAEKPLDAEVLFSPEVAARLRAVKADVDPGNLFRGNHALLPAT